MGLFEIITDLLPLASAIGLVVLMIVLMPPRKKSSHCDLAGHADHTALESPGANCELSEP